MTDIGFKTTSLLAAIARGDRDANNKLFSIMYRELHQLAHQAMQRERLSDHLQTTELVHETYIRLVPQGELRCRDRAHFFSVAGRVMRRILVEHARKRKAIKRGGGQSSVTLDELMGENREAFSTEMALEDLEALDKALEKLESREDQKWSRAIVDMHFFVGLSFKKIAEILELSKAKVVREWVFARAWLRQEIDR